MIQFQPLFCRWELAWGQVERCPWMPARAAILACCACGHFGRKRTSPPPSPFPTASALLRGGTAKAPLLGAPRPAAARGGAWRPHPPPRQLSCSSGSRPPARLGAGPLRLQRPRRVRADAGPLLGVPKRPDSTGFELHLSQVGQWLGVWSAEGAGRGWRGHPALLGRTVERPPGAPRLRTGVGEGRGGTGCGGEGFLAAWLGAGHFFLETDTLPAPAPPFLFGVWTPLKCFGVSVGAEHRSIPSSPSGLNPPHL